mmetsp:Transcript_24091/g.45349  ORF Transcript_24091/g.45349 Transcript_24091/m.45349 type:complete len:233 (-) Transcript_24091:1623-2321(-)
MTGESSPNGGIGWWSVSSRQVVVALLLLSTLPLPLSLSLSLSSGFSSSALGLLSSTAAGFLSSSSSGTSPSTSPLSSFSRSSFSCRFFSFALSIMSFLSSRNFFFFASSFPLAKLSGLLGEGVPVRLLSSSCFVRASTRLCISLAAFLTAFFSALSLASSSRATLRATSSTGPALSFTAPSSSLRPRMVPSLSPSSLLKRSSSLVIISVCRSTSSCFPFTCISFSSSFNLSS